MRARRVTANVLLASGSLLLAIPAAHVATAVRAQNTELSGEDATRTSGTVRAGEAWGRLEIPRVGLKCVVFEGVGVADLRKGPGHLPESAAPGAEAGNCVIAGHRDTFFRPLARARRGDVVLLRGRDGTVSRYRLESKRVVSPEEVSVMAPTKDRRLTLITCYPFHWVGPAPHRLVWKAVASGSPAKAGATASTSGAGARPGSGR